MHWGSLHNNGAKLALDLLAKLLFAAQIPTQHLQRLLQRQHEVFGYTYNSYPFLILTHFHKRPNQKLDYLSWVTKGTQPPISLLVEAESQKNLFASGPAHKFNTDSQYLKYPFLSFEILCMYPYLFPILGYLHARFLKGAETVRESKARDKVGSYMTDRNKDNLNALEQAANEKGTSEPTSLIFRLILFIYFLNITGFIKTLHHFSIYHWAEFCTTLDMDSPLLPLALQVFFSLYFQRNEQGIYFGHKFFDAHQFQYVPTLVFF